MYTHPYTVCANNKIRVHHSAICESNGAGLIINALAASGSIDMSALGKRRVGNLTYGR